MKENLIFPINHRLFIQQASKSKQLKATKQATQSNPHLPTDFSPKMSISLRAFGYKIASSEADRRQALRGAIIEHGVDAVINRVDTILCSKCTPEMDEDLNWLIFEKTRLGGSSMDSPKEPETPEKSPPVSSYQALIDAALERFKTDVTTYYNNALLELTESLTNVIMSAPQVPAAPIKVPPTILTTPETPTKSSATKSSTVPHNPLSKYGYRINDLVSARQDALDDAIYETSFSNVLSKLKSITPLHPNVEMDIEYVHSIAEESDDEDDDEYTDSDDDDEMEDSDEEENLMENTNKSTVPHIDLKLSNMGYSTKLSTEKRHEILANIYTIYGRPVVKARLLEVSSLCYEPTKRSILLADYHWV